MDIPKLDFYVKNDLNALFVGKHGTGKTTTVIDCFKRNNLKYAYFSASTMDPWVDFIGIPKEKTENGKSYIELIKPRCFADDDINAIFFDEFNRSPKKVRNAVMELIQFKSINGHKLNNLKIVWAAINPKDEEETYDVEKLDPAQEDRFHVRIEVPYNPDRAYFKLKFGEIGINAVDWWQELPDPQKELVSPRRLDYAVEIYNKQGDLRDVLNKGLNVTKLVQELNSGSFIKRLKRLVEDNDPVQLAQAFSDENFYSSTIGTITKDNGYIKICAPYLPKEKLVTQLAGDNEFVKKFTKAVEDDPAPFMEVLASVPTKGKTTDAAKELEKWKLKIDFYGKQASNNPLNKVATPGNASWINKISGGVQVMTQTPHRIDALGILNDKAKVLSLTNSEFRVWVECIENLCKSLQVQTLKSKCGLNITSLCKIMYEEYCRRFNTFKAPATFPQNLIDVINFKNINGTAFTFWTAPAVGATAVNKTAAQLLNQVTGNTKLPYNSIIPIDDLIEESTVEDKDDIPFYFTS